MIKVKLAKTAGVCFGVERALQISEKALNEKSGPLSSLGPLIHNPQVVEKLSERGLEVASDLESIKGSVVFRSHGVPIETETAARQLGINIIDATCPLVKVPQRLARKLSLEGYYVVIVGDENHPEVIGVRSYVEDGRVVVVKDASEIGKIPDCEKVGVICQTTLKKATVEEVVEKCRSRFAEVKFQNTICSATKDRQDAAYELAREVDCVVVIGGRNSSNTQKLFGICQDLAPKAFLIETEEELQKEWFVGLESVGITAGASTPHELIEKVRQKVLTLSH